MRRPSAKTSVAMKAGGERDAASSAYAGPRAIGLFLLFTLGISMFFWWLALGVHGSPYYTTGLMWAPALGAMLTHCLRREDFGTLGLSGFGGRYAVIGYLLPLFYGTVAYGLIWSLGFGHFPDPAAVTRIERELGWQVGPAAFIPLFVLLIATTGILPGLARALGEEIGWRGFLLPRLAHRMGPTWGALVSGLIWTAWHVPLLIFGDYHSAAPRWFALSCFAVMVVSLSFVLAWLRLKSGSVWPCAILHACHNILIQVVFTPLTADRGAITGYAADEFGFAVPTVAFIIALSIWRTETLPSPRVTVAASRPHCRRYGADSGPQEPMNPLKANS
jgi:uncharacterized protein